MKESSKPSIEFFFAQTLPPVSFRYYPNSQPWKERLIRRAVRRYGKTIELSLAAMGIGTLFLTGIYLFCIQLAEYGW